jgi:hypothetical protein
MRLLKKADGARGNEVAGRKYCVPPSGGLSQTRKRIEAILKTALPGY